MKSPRAIQKILFTAVSISIACYSPSFSARIDVIKDSAPDTYTPVTPEAALTSLNALSHPRNVSSVSVVQAAAVAHRGTVIAPGDFRSATAIPIEPLNVQPQAANTGPLSFTFKKVTSCGTLSAPGTYELKADLTTTTNCLIIAGTGITLECLGNSITVNSPNEAYAIKIQNSSQVQIQDCDLKGGLRSDNSSNVTITGNTYESSRFAQAAIDIRNGSHNTVTNNQINGGWDGNEATWSSQGLDSGIVLWDEDSDTVSGNTVQSVWDAGVETFGKLTNTTLTNNTFTNTGYTGFGAYHGTSWIGNTISGNQVTNSPNLAAIYFGDNRFNEVIPTIYFQNNTITGNVFQNPINLPPPPNNSGGLTNSILIDFTLDANRNPLPVPVVAGNNVISNNNLGNQSPGPLLLPGTAFVNGGGNICGPQSTIACSNTKSVLSEAQARESLIRTLRTPPLFHWKSSLDSPLKSR